MDELTAFAALRPSQRPADITGARDRLTAEIEAGPRRRVSRRARFTIAAGTAVAAAAAAITVPAVLPQGGGAFTGTAWAVDQQSDGTVAVSLKEEFNDPAGLQRALRADGINAYVRSTPMKSTWLRGQELIYMSCVYNVKKYIIHVPGAVTVHFASAEGMLLVVRPSVIPAKSLLFLVTASFGRTSLVERPMILRITHLPACVPVHP
jgi:hypothetical protein